MEHASGSCVVVGVDGSPANEAALRWAFDEAARRGVGIGAVLISRYWSTTYPYLPGISTEAVTAAAEGRLLRAIEGVDSAGVPVTRTVRAAAPVPGLQAEARNQGAALLVVGRRGHGRLARLLVGSVSDALAQDPRQPLVVVPSDGERDQAGTGGQRIVVGVDGSVQSLVALRWAVAEAKFRDAKVEAIMAWSMAHLELLPLVPPAYDNERAVQRRAQEELDAQIAELRVHDGFKVEGRLIRGDPASVLLEAASAADLVVVGTRGLGVIRQRVLGSTSHAVLHHCPAPLVIVPTHPGDDNDATSSRAVVEPGTA